MLDFLKGVDIENTDKATVDLLKSMGEAVEARIEEYLKGVIDKDAMEKSINEALKSIDSRQELASVKEQITEVKESLVRMKGAFECKDGKVQVKSIEAQIEEQLKEYITLEKGKKIVDLKSACQNGNGKKFTMNLVVKAASETTSFNTSYTLLGAYTDTLTQNPRQESVLRRFANVAPANGRAVLYAEVQYGDEQAEWVEEGALKPLMTGGVVQKSVTSVSVCFGYHFVADYIEHCSSGESQCKGKNCRCDTNSKIAQQGTDNLHQTGYHCTDKCFAWCYAGSEQRTDNDHSFWNVLQSDTTGDNYCLRCIVGAETDAGSNAFGQIMNSNSGNK